VRVLSSRFRKKFLRQLEQAFRKGTLCLCGELRPLAEPAAFRGLCEKASAIDWVVHVKPPFGGPQRVLKYLARYTHRVAISNPACDLWSRAASPLTGRITRTAAAPKP